MLTCGTWCSVWGCGLAKCRSALCLCLRVVPDVRWWTHCLYCTLLYYTVLYCAVLYCAVLCCIGLYCTVRSCPVLSCTKPGCTVL